MDKHKNWKMLADFKYNTCNANILLAKDNGL
jgi:hypothetical protein